MKKVLIFIIAVLLTLSNVCFLSCKKSTVKENDFEKLVVDFESVNELMSVSLTAHEAQKSLNTNKKYVSHGEKSMKMHLNQAQSVIGYYEDTTLQFVPGQQYFNYTDFSNVIGISADIWNDNGFDIQMCFSLNNKAFVIGYYTLKPGYNKVEFNYDNNQVIAVTDKQLRTLDFSFYSENGNEVIYIDNVRLQTTPNQYMPYDFGKYYNDGLIFGYEDFVEQMIVIDLGGYDSLFSRAKTCINVDKKYVTQGNGSLEVKFFNSPKDGNVDNNQIRTYDNILPNFNDFVKGDWALKCDVFNATDRTVNMELKVFSTTDDETCSKVISINANSWADKNECCLPISAIREAFTSSQIKVLSIVYNFIDIQAGDTVYIDNVRLERRNVYGQ